MPPQDRFIHETRFHVRYVETDRMGVVHHANYVIYCEEARNQFSRDMGASYADFEKQGLFLVVSEVNLRYLAPAVFGQEIRIRTWLEAMKSRRITFGYEIANPATEVVHATAEVRLICTNLEGIVQRIPQSWVDAWSKAIDSHS
jgi:acyl-CoA thioester hydrolase